MRAPTCAAQAVDELRADLVEGGCHSAALLVAAGCRKAVDAVLADVARSSFEGATRRAVAALVSAWGRGDDASVLRGQQAWLLQSGCASCVVAAVEGRSACVLCLDDARRERVAS